MEQGYLQMLLRAGARIHQAGCNGCIGMGQAPATNRISLRTVPRNFPGRSGTREDAVYLCSPETAAASALTGQITDPRELGEKFGIMYVQPREPETIIINKEQLVPPPLNGEDFELEKGPNITSLPDFEPLPDTVEGPVLLKLGDGVSTDEIMPAGARVLPFRSNIPEISKFAFSQIDASYYERTMPYRESGSYVVGGANYGQGSSREHAAIAPRYLGLRVVIAKSFARIHLQNLANFGILGLTFADASDYDEIEQGDRLGLRNLRSSIENDEDIELLNLTRNQTYLVRHSLSSRQKASVLAGSLIELVSADRTGE